MHEGSWCCTGDPRLTPRSERSPEEGIDYPLQYSWASVVAQLIKNPPATQETWVWLLGYEDPLEKGIPTPVFWPGKFHGLYSPMGCKELDTTEQLFQFEWSSGFPYFLQFKSEFCNKEFMMWATVISQSCFCWLYRASPSSAANNTINWISVLNIWWCPCVESSLALLEEGVCYDQCVLLAKLY